MDERDFSFSYNEAQRTLNLTITEPLLAHLREDWSVCLGSARLCMASYISEGRFSHIYLNEQLFAQAWSYLQKNPGKCPVSLPLAHGFNLLEHLDVDMDSNQAAILLTLNYDNLGRMKISRFSDFYYSVLYLLREKKHYCLPQRASLQTIWLKYFCSIKPVNSRYTVPVALKPKNLAKKVYFVTEKAWNHLVLRVASRPRYKIKQIDVMIDQELKIWLKSISSPFYYFDRALNLSFLKRFQEGYHKLNLGFPDEYLIAYAWQAQELLPLGCDEVADEIALEFALLAAQSFEEDTYKNWQCPISDIHQRISKLKGHAQKLISCRRLRVSLARCISWAGKNQQHFSEKLKILKAGINLVHGDQRNIQSLTLTLHPQELLKVKNKIKLMLQDLSGSCDDTPTEPTQHILFGGIELFPLTVQADSAQQKILKKQLPRAREWQRIIVRELVALDSFKNDYAWVAKKLALPLSQEEYEEAFESLVKMGFIKFNVRTGRFDLIHQDLKSADDVRGSFLKNFHAVMLDIAQAYLHVPFSEDCEIHWYARPVGQAMFADCQSKVMSSLAEIFEISSTSKSPTELYQLSIQMYLL